MQVSIVGAGPGNPDYITVAGVKALENADVILYDALANPELLSLYSPNSEWICVGKRAGKHSFKQHEIHEIYQYYANTKANIVRLKGGDPSVFARNTEELQFLESLGVKTQVIPGISAYTGIAADHQIALTSRGLAESLWILTGTTKTEELSHDILLATQSSATLVFYMGIQKLPEIVSLLIQNKGIDFPIAVIQNGTLDHENSAFGTASNIQEIVAKKNIGSPALIIAGESLRNHTSLNIQSLIQTIQHEQPIISNFSEGT